MKKQFKMGIIGCGDIAKFIVLFVRFNRNIKLVACSDINADRAKSFGDKIKSTHYYTDYKEMIKNVEMDAVYISVPHFLHYPIIKDCLEAGLHVFCEKPITTNLEDALKIVELSKQTGKKVGINYQYRYDSGCYALAMAAQRGDLGELYYGRCNVPWHRTLSYFDTGQWRKNIETAGGGTLITHASHLLDILLWGLGGKPVYATGQIKTKKFQQIEVEDLAMGIIEMDNGRLAHVTSSMISYPEQKVTIELYGDKGTALYKGPDIPSIKFKGVRPKKAKLPMWGVHALQKSIEAFRRWIVDDDPFLCSAESAIPVLSTVLAIYQSSSSGKKEAIRY